MNYTTNYHLPQWVESDRILMEDFNDAMAGIDQGLQGAKAAADTAESKADAAQAAAETAQSSADALADAYTPDNKPYVVGSYSGTGNTQTIEVGFRPSAVLVGKHYSSADASEAGGMCALIGGGGVSGILLFKDNGFTVYDNTTILYPSVNWKYGGYWYVAFR